jgi:hypothetical protein
VVHLRVGQHIGRVLAAELQPQRGEGASGRLSIARPPATEPVKLMWSIVPEPSSVSVWPWFSTMFWNRPLGRPALSKAAWKRSPTSSVWAACFRITALPAISAGTMVLTAVR